MISKVSKYPCIQRKRISMYPYIHVSKYPWYPSIQLSKYPKKIGIQDIQISGYQKKVVSVHPYWWAIWARGLLYAHTQNISNWKDGCIEGVFTPFATSFFSGFSAVLTLLLFSTTGNKTENDEWSLKVLEQGLCLVSRRRAVLLTFFPLSNSKQFSLHDTWWIGKWAATAN